MRPVNPWPRASGFSKSSGIRTRRPRSSPNWPNFPAPAEAAEAAVPPLTADWHLFLTCPHARDYDAGRQEWFGADLLDGDRWLTGGSLMGDFMMSQQQIEDEEVVVVDTTAEQEQPQK